MSAPFWAKLSGSYMLNYAFSFITLRSEAQNPVTISPNPELYEMFLLGKNTDVVKKLL